jgi:arylsulfatase A-like enzyme/Tfp pilus assembly protein PilF
MSAVLAAAGGWRYARASAPLSGPIIVVSIDTLRADHLPAYGYTKIKTPAIDLLASNGVVFERAYSHAPDTLAAHVALLSGRLPFETGVRGGSGGRVRPGERLLSQMLRERGYATAGIISSSVLRRESGIAQGFEFFDDDMPPAEPTPAAEFTERDGAISEALAERWLDSMGTSRAFLFLHLDEPHAPYAAPSRLAGYAPYDAEIVYADEIVGTLVRYLKSHQLYDRSTIVLLSDHGEGLGDHGEREHGLFAYGNTIRVPLIIKQEGNDGAGRRVTDLVQHIDLVPTILDLVKAPAAGALRGRSLKPLLDGSGSMPERQVYSEALYAHSHFGWSELTALTDGRYQYVRAPREELYDLARDPHERANLLEPDPGVALAPDVAKASATLRADLQRLLPAAAPTASDAGESAVDPKDKRQFVDAYRASLDAAGRGQWPQAIGQLQHILHMDPDVAEAWNTLAELSALMGRYDLALDAYRHIVVLRPSETSGYLGAADVLFRQRKLDDARVQALAAIDRAIDSDTRTRASAHELLARIALARHDVDQAQVEAGLAHQADPRSVMPAFVDARALYDQGKFDDALPIFEDATTTATKTSSAVENLHFYAGDTLQHLDRPSEAESEFLEELRYFPHNLRAATALVALYQMQDRVDEAEEALTRILRTTPTPEAYAMASRILKAIGNTKRSNAVRAEAARLFTDSRSRDAAGH